MLISILLCHAHAPQVIASMLGMQAASSLLELDLRENQFTAQGMTVLVSTAIYESHSACSGQHMSAKKARKAELVTGQHVAIQAACITAQDQNKLCSCY